MSAEEQRSADAVIDADVVIVGAGPAGLFQVFELGLLGIKAHVVDSLAHPGGQCTELYPDKPIYDIPALPVCGAQELVDRLLKQIAPFEPSFHLGQEVAELQRLEDGRFFVRTALGAQFHARTVVIAAGLGSFQPRRLVVPGARRIREPQVHYRVRNARDFHGQRLVILGGGDSALDWVLDLHGKAASIVHVHRRPEFKAAPASVARMQQLAAAGLLTYVEGIATGLRHEGGRLSRYHDQACRRRKRRLRHGSRARLFRSASEAGPDRASGNSSSRRRQSRSIPRNSRPRYPASIAVGDINTYPGKKKLILSGFHEAALAAFAIAEHLNPAKKVHLQYTTTSPIMHKRLGVPD